MGLDYPVCDKSRMVGADALPADGPYILYLPRSSGLRFSSHFLMSSGELLSADNAVDTVLEDFVITSSVTKFGESMRNANAMASDGRESTVMVLPPAFKKIRA